MIGEAPGSTAGAGAKATPKATSRLAWSMVGLSLALVIAGQLLSRPADGRSVGDFLLYDVSWLAIGTAAFAFSEAFTAGPLSDSPRIVNPYGIDHPALDVAGVGGPLILVALLASVASVVVRFRRAQGVERQQIKWLALAGCFAAAAFVPAV